MKTQILNQATCFFDDAEALKKLQGSNISAVGAFKKGNNLFDSKECRVLNIVAENHFAEPASDNQRSLDKICALEEQNKDLLDSLNYTRKLQEAVLPDKEKMKKMVGEHFVFNKPKDIVSGDFYFAEPISSNGGRSRIAFAIADCTGHGVRGALMSMLSYGFLKSVLNNRCNSAGEILDHLNCSITGAFQTDSTFQKVRDGMDISLCVLDKESKILEFAGANSKGIVVKKDKTIVELTPDKHAIGYEEQKALFNTTFIKLEERDMVYLFSDGYKDQFGGVNGKKLGYKNFITKLAEMSDMPMDEQSVAFEDFFSHWKGELAQLDDILMLGVRI